MSFRGENQAASLFFGVSFGTKLASCVVDDNGMTTAGWLCTVASLHIDGSSVGAETTLLVSCSDWKLSTRYEILGSSCSTAWYIAPTRAHAANLVWWAILAPASGHAESESQCFYFRFCDLAEVVIIHLARFGNKKIWKVKISSSLLCFEARNCWKLE
jgi:hypothetical protein